MSDVRDTRDTTTDAQDGTHVHKWEYLTDAREWCPSCARIRVSARGARRIPGTLQTITMSEYDDLLARARIAGYYSTIARYLTDAQKRARADLPNAVLNTIEILRLLIADWTETPEAIETDRADDQMILMIARDGSGTLGTVRKWGADFLTDTNAVGGMDLWLKFPGIGMIASFLAHMGKERNVAS